MNRGLEAKLIEGLDALDRGDAVEEILARYPAGEAEALRPMLETAIAVSRVRPAHSLAAEATSKKAFLKQAKMLREDGASPRPGGGLFRRFFMAVAAVALLLIVSTAGLTIASQNAIPGDALYDVKRAAEDVRLFLTVDPAAREGLVRQFEEERTLEAYEMLESGREGEVEYFGIVEAKTPTQWEVGHLTMYLTEDTVFVGSPQVGDRVHAICDVREGRALAKRVEVVADNVEPAPPTPIPEDTGTEEAQGDVSPSSVDRNPTTATIPPGTPTATATAELSPTAVDTPAPTAPPALTTTPDDRDDEDDGEMEDGPGAEPDDDTETDSQPRDDDENDDSADDSHDEGGEDNTGEDDGTDDRDGEEGEDAEEADDGEEEDE